MTKADSACVWVVDDDRAVRFVLAEALRDAGWRVQAFDSGDVALRAAEQGERADLVFTDVRMPGLDGLGFLAALKRRTPHLPVIVMSAYTDVASTAGAFRGGAHEFLSKPFDLDEAVALAARALPGHEPEPAPATPSTAHGDEHALIGGTPAMRELFRSIGRLAQAPLAVLILGETGTGKELVARALHRESPRAARPFVALNTAAIPAELLESELFGHEAGAFTGAGKRHIGRFEQADGGTLFLDEIGDMPAALQTRLLRVLAEGEFFRVGGRELIRVDVRVIAATHQDLDARVADGRFRADLLHRLDVVRLRLPPLRERSADVPLLAIRFLDQACRQLGLPAKQLQPAALSALQQHDWPGNVRELENVCWRLAALAPNERIGARDLALAFRGGHAASASGRWESLLAAEVTAALARGEQDLHAGLRERFDRSVLEAALAHCDGHRQQAAERLGLGRNTLTRKLGPGRRGRH
ncbi:MAG TPA: nitrogen regulation protein NR(I) [Arenimonas sp.]|nr:nitrogen regulation protein NR(I) [Arenimonas sp.]